jgi:uncharacterized protein (DUF362 family)
VSKVAKVKFTDYQNSINKALDLIGAADALPQQGLIIIKPNLTNADKPPVTTPVEIVEAIYNYCKTKTTAEIAIGEGCGSGTTEQTYRANGYMALAEKYNIRLIDFNTEKAVKINDSRALQVKKFYIPEILLDAFVISVPILKDHCFTKTTIAMKNMFGIAPEPFYGGSWNKSQLHSPSTDKSVYDLCLYKKPGLCVVDAVVALKGMHLSGTPKKFDVILASTDPVAIDAVGSQMLGHDPKKIEYLTLANGVIGDINNVEIVQS